LHLFLRHHEWSRPPRTWVAALALWHLVKDLTRTLSCAIADHQGQQSCQIPLQSANRHDVDHF
jgi:hypothetical protein